MLDKCLSFSIILLIVSFTQTSSVKAEPLQLNIYTIGFKPYGIDEDGHFSGIYFEFANALAKDAGYVGNNKVVPYARVVSALKQGKIDLTIMFRNPALEQYVDYVAALPSKKIVVIGLQNWAISHLDDLAGQKLAYLRGAKFYEPIDTNTAISKYHVVDYRQGVRLLMAGRVDAIIGSLQSINNAVASIQNEDNMQLTLGEPLVLEVKTPWVQLSKKHAEHIDMETLKRSFSKLQAGQTFEALQTKYGQ